MSRFQDKSVTDGRTDGKTNRPEFAGPYCKAGGPLTGPVITSQ